MSEEWVLAGTLIVDGGVIESSSEPGYFCHVELSGDDGSSVITCARNIPDGGVVPLQFSLELCKGGRFWSTDDHRVNIPHERRYDVHNAAILVKKEK